MSQVEQTRVREVITKRIRARSGWPAGLFVLALALFILSPIVAMFYGALRPSLTGPALELSFEAVADVYLSSEVWMSLVGTVAISLTVALVATFFGTAFAWFLTRTDVPWRGALELLVLAPLFMSPFVAAIAWYALAAPRNGFLNRAWGDVTGGSGEFVNITSVWGIIWVLALHTMPYAYVFVSSSLRNMDPALEAASYVNGVGVLGTVRRVTLPMITPAIGSSIMFITIFAAGVFSVPGVLGRTLGFDPLPVLIYRAVTQFRADYAQAAALGSMLFLLSIAFLYLYRRLTRMERKFVTVSGKGFQPRLLNLGRMRYGVAAGACLYGVVCVGLPTAALVIAALSPFTSRDLGNLNLSVDYAQSVLSDPSVRSAATNTLWVVLATAIVCVLIALVSVLIARGWERRIGVAGLEYLNSFPLAIPGIVLAAGLVWVYIRTPIYATLALLVIAYVISHVPHSYRLIRNGSLQISRELEEASFVNNVGRFGTAMRITAPLLRPAVFASVTLITIFVIREVNSVILLYTPRTRVLSVLTWDYIADGNLSSAATVGLLQTLLLVLALVVARLVFRINLTNAYR